MIEEKENISVEYRNPPGKQRITLTTEELRSIARHKRKENGPLWNCVMGPERKGNWGLPTKGKATLSGGINRIRTRWIVNSTEFAEKERRRVQ